MTPSTRIYKFIASCLSTLLVVTNCALVHSAESNLWKERQKNLQLAQLPASIKPGIQPQIWVDQLPDLTSRIPNGTSTTQKKTLQNIISLTSPYGTIRNITRPHSNKTKKFLLHIQDVHGNLEAQRNIGGMIQSLIDNDLVDLVGLEGAFDKLNFSPIREFPHAESIQKTADYLLRKNKITGPIHTALTSPKTIPVFVGVDDLTHYTANVEAYKNSTVMLETTQARLGKMERDLQESKRTHFNPHLKSFDEKITAYRNKKLPLGEYGKFLGSFNFKEKPSVKIFLQALSLEESLNFKQVESERRMFLSKLVSKLNKTQIADFMEASVALQSHRISSTNFYRYLENLAAKADLNLAAHSQLEKYIRYVFLSESINADQLFQDLREAEKSVYSQLTETKKEKDLIKKSRALYLSQNLVDFSLTPEEWAEYSNIRSFEYSLNLSSFERFYRQAEIRDQKIVNNLIHHQRKENAKTTILVTGGFHTKGIEHRINNKDINENLGVAILSFVPKITRIEEDGNNSYLGLFAQKQTPLEELFEGKKLFLTQKVYSPSAQAQSIFGIATHAFRTAPQLLPQIKTLLLNVLGWTKVNFIKVSNLVYRLIGKKTVEVEYDQNADINDIRLLESAETSGAMVQSWFGKWNMGFGDRGQWVQIGLLMPLIEETLRWGSDFGLKTLFGFNIGWWWAVFGFSAIHAALHYWTDKKEGKKLDEINYVENNKKITDYKTKLFWMRLPGRFLLSATFGLAFVFIPKFLYYFIIGPTYYTVVPFFTLAILSSFLVHSLNNIVIYPKVKEYEKPWLLMSTGGVVDESEPINPRVKYLGMLDVTFPKPKDENPLPPLQRSWVKSDKDRARAFEDPEFSEFTDKEFSEAFDAISNVTKVTPLLELELLSELTGKKVFLKDEAFQEAGSFKIRGVYYQVLKTIEDVIEKAKAGDAESLEQLKAGIKIVTQTTGNHGFAVIRATSLVVQHLLEKYKDDDFPNLLEYIRKIEPVIFTLKNIPPIKSNNMSRELADFRLNFGQKAGKIVDEFDKYTQAIAAREKFLAETPSARYMNHSERSVLLGNGATLVAELADQLKPHTENNEKVVFLASVAAGGPLGNAAALKMYMDNASMVMVQPDRWDAFVRTLQTGEPQLNPKGIAPTVKFVHSGDALTYPDGVAADGPEGNAPSYARAYLDAAVSVDELRALQNSGVLLWQDILTATNDENRVRVGGTTASTAEALLQFRNTLEVIRDADVVVLFGTEGNVDERFFRYHKSRQSRLPLILDSYSGEIEEGKGRTIEYEGEFFPYKAKSQSEMIHFTNLFNLTKNSPKDHIATIIGLQGLAEGIADHTIPDPDRRLRAVLHFAEKPLRHIMEDSPDENLSQTALRALTASDKLFRKGLEERAAKEKPIRHKPLSEWTLFTKKRKAATHSYRYQAGRTEALGLNTPRFISDEGRRSSIKKFINRVLIHAWQMTVAANPKKKEKDVFKVGSHPTASASSLNLVGGLYLHGLKGHDIVFIKPHGQPVDKSAQYNMGLLHDDPVIAEKLMHKLRDEAIKDPMRRFKKLLSELPAYARAELTEKLVEITNTMPGIARELLDEIGIPSYPTHDQPGIPQGPTGSVGLGESTAGFIAILYKILKDHGHEVPEDQVIFAHIGDAEGAEGNSLEALSAPVEFGVTNLVVVMDSNGQSLDNILPEWKRTERINQHLIAGYDVIELRYGRWLRQEMRNNHFFKLFLEGYGERGGITMEEHRWLMRISTPETLRENILKMVSAPNDLFPEDAIDGLKAYLDTWRNKKEDFYNLMRDLGGHDDDDIAWAYAEARKRDKPVLIVAETWKGYGMNEWEGHPGNHGYTIGPARNPNEMETLEKKFGYHFGKPFVRLPENELITETRNRFKAEQKAYEELKKRNEDKFENPFSGDQPLVLRSHMLNTFTPVQSSRNVINDILKDMMGLNNRSEEQMEQELEQRITRIEEQYAGDRPTIIMETIKARQNFEYLLKIRKIAERIFGTTPDIGRSTFPATRTSTYGTPTQSPRVQSILDDLRKEKSPLLNGVDRSLLGHFLDMDIAEMKAINMAAALGKSFDLYGVRLLPMVTVYDSFIVRRAYDILHFLQLWESRVVAFGVPSGFMDVPAEGSKHQSRETMMDMFMLPNTVGVEIFAPQEAEIWMTDISERTMGNVDDGRYLNYIKPGTFQTDGDDLKKRLMALKKYQSWSWEQIEADWKTDVLNGGYVLVEGMDMEGYDPQYVRNIVTAGTITSEVLHAADFLKKSGFFPRVVVVTSPDILYGEYRHSPLNEAGIRELLADEEKNDKDLLQLKKLFPREIRDPKNTPDGMPAKLIAVANGHPAVLEIAGAKLGMVTTGSGLTGNGLSVPDPRKFAHHDDVRASRVHIWSEATMMYPDFDHPPSELSTKQASRLLKRQLDDMIAREKKLGNPANALQSNITRTLWNYVAPNDLWLSSKAEKFLTTGFEWAWLVGANLLTVTAWVYGLSWAGDVTLLNIVLTVVFVGTHKQLNLKKGFRIGLIITGSLAAAMALFYFPLLAVLVVPLILWHMQNDQKVFSVRNEKIADLLDQTMGSPSDFHLRNLYTEMAQDDLSEAQIAQSKKLLKAAQLIREQDWSIDEALRQADLLSSGNVVLMNGRFSGGLEKTLKQLNTLGEMTARKNSRYKTIVIVESTQLIQKIMSGRGSYPHLTLISGENLNLSGTIYASELDSTLKNSIAKAYYQTMGHAKIIHPLGVTYIEDSLDASSPLIGSGQRTFILSQILGFLTTIAKPLNPSNWIKVFRAIGQSA